MKTKFFIITLFVYFNSCFAQVPNEQITIAEYPAFYTNTINKLDLIIPNKTLYYGLPFSNFLQILSQNNLTVKEYEAAAFSNKTLKIKFLWNSDVDLLRMKNGFVSPYILIYFQQPYNFQQATTIFNNSYHSYWNTTAEKFYKDLIIEKIEFWYVRGLTDKSNNPK